jgi:hypothetical protein
MPREAPSPCNQWVIGRVGRPALGVAGLTQVALRAGQTQPIHLDGHRGPAPLEATAGASRRRCRVHRETGLTVSADQSLHTAGPNYPDRTTRQDLLGPATNGEGPGRGE